MKWTSVVFVDEYILKKMKAKKTSLEDINAYEHYSLKNDKEHDYKKYIMAYKFEDNSKEPTFLIVFGENGVIDDFKFLGKLNKKQLKLLRKITKELNKINNNLYKVKQIVAKTKKSVD